MDRRRRELIDLGVYPQIADRKRYPILKCRDGSVCRDRQAWGGISFPDRCDCGLDGKGRACRYDLEQAEAER